MTLKEGPHDQLLMLLAVTAHSSLQMHIEGPLIVYRCKALDIDITRLTFTEWQGSLIEGSSSCKADSLSCCILAGSDD